MGGPPAKKRNGCLTALVIGGGLLALLVVLGIVIAALGGGGDDSATTRASTDGTAASPTSAAAGAPATTTPAASGCAPVTYPDKQAKDRGCTEPGTSIDLSGYTVTVASVERYGNSFQKLVCAQISIVNRDKKAQRYAQFDFRMQTPGGEVKDSTFSDRDDNLGSGDLVGGGSKSGSVCWDDSAASGRHILIWKPDAFNADRGIWFVNL